MSIFAVKNDKGLLMDDLGQFKRDRNVCAFHSKSDAKDWADNKHAHVVELTDAPEKIVVSAEEAEILETAKNPTYRPSSVITSYSNDHHGWDLTSDLEDRLMRAYVNGWTVEKSKQWNVKVPHTSGDYYCKFDSDNVKATHGAFNSEKQTFTAAEIEHYGLQDCEKVEV